MTTTYEIITAAVVTTITLSGWWKHFATKVKLEFLLGERLALLWENHELRESLEDKKEGDDGQTNS
jgi:hypothetical protein